MKIQQYEFQSGLGKIHLVASDRGLCGLYWEKQDHPIIDKLRTDIPAHGFLREAARQLGEYLEGKRREFDLELDFAGTPFQESVWKALRGIPFGATLSYKQLAARIGNPNAVRAVGTANGRNPLCIIIPCHRVIASDGSLGGYVGGLPIKAKLLALERA